MQKPFTVAILADIHGILPALDAVLADMEANPPDQIIIAGDFLGGPQPCEVLQRLQAIGCRFILGNGEVNMLKMRYQTAPAAWWTHHQFDMGRWIFQRLNQAVFSFLERLNEQTVLTPPGAQPVRVVHG